MDGASPHGLRLAVLGPVRAWRGSTALDLGPVRRQAVLAALALRPGILVSHDQLLDETDGRPRVLGRTLTCAADAHLLLGHYGEAKRRFRQAVELGEQVGDTLTRLGTAERGEGNPAAAIALHHQALRQHQLLNPLTDPSYDWLEMDIRSRLGYAYLATGRVGEAHAQFQAVLEVRNARAQRAGRRKGSPHPDETRAGQGLRPTPQ